MEDIYIKQNSVWRERWRAFLLRINKFMEKFIQEADHLTGH